MHLGRCRQADGLAGQAFQARKAGKQFLITRSAARAYYEGLPLADRKETDKEDPRAHSNRNLRFGDNA